MNKKILLLIFLLSACTRSVLNVAGELEGPPDADYSELSENNRVSLETARGNIQKAVLTCSPGSCPDGVGLLAAVGQNNHEDPSQRYFHMDTCTISFVKLKESNSQEQLYGITAGHCIPNRLRNKGTSCAADISIKVIKGSNIKCESVEFVSAPDNDPNVSQFDIALLKVSSDSPISTYELSQKPLKDSNKPFQIKMLAADPLSDEEAKSRLRETECWYLQNSYIVPESTEPTDPFMVTRGCSFIDGNSGAPIMDGGAIIGIQSRYIRYKDKLIPDGSVTVASNLYCFDAQKKSLRCAASQPLKFADEENGYHLPSYLNLLRKKDAKFLDQSTQKALAILASGSKLFESYKDMPGFSKTLTYHDFKKDHSHYLRIPFPNCYDPKALPSELKDGVDMSGKNVIVYGLRLTNRNRIPENRFKLSLYHTLIQPDLILYHRGGGNFRIESSLLPQKFADISLNPCR